MTITEIASLPLKAGSNIHDENNQAGKAAQEAVVRLRRQDGFEEMWVGMGVESPNLLEMFINWDKIESHHKFEQSPDFGPALEDLGAIGDGPPTLIHVDFHDTGALHTALGAPVTELVKVYLPSESFPIETNGQKLLQVLAQHASGFVGAARGWAVEDAEHESLGAGIKGRLYVLAIGWQSVDAHVEFTKTDHFKDNIHLVRNISKATEMHHVQLKKP